MTIGGTLNMKILKRTAQFDSLETASTPLTAQNIKLNIPKKTKLFVDQVRRIINDNDDDDDDDYDDDDD